MTPLPAPAPCPLTNISSSADLELRARLLTAARQRFLRFSHENTSLEDLARAAGLKLSQVHKHFKDVYAVMVALERALVVGSVAPRGPRPLPRGLQRHVAATRHQGER
ncbi:MAG TPA: hypothetical protein VGN70_06665 [Gammaproteobacteria bacterium]|jgi:AcrR family transcriptional regulator